MIKCCNCKEIFETEDDLSDIVEKTELIDGKWHATDRFILQGLVPEDTKTVRYEVFKGCPNCMGDRYLKDLSNKVLKVKRKQFKDGLLKFRIDSTYLESVGRNPSVKIMRKYWGEDAYCIRCGSYLYNVSEEIYDYFKEHNSGSND